MFDRLKEEINSIKARDPAVRSALEVIFLYPSFKAVRSYRRAHWFYEHGHFFIARWISQSCRTEYGETQVTEHRTEVRQRTQIGRAHVELQSR